MSATRKPISQNRRLPVGLKLFFAPALLWLVTGQAVAQPSIKLDTLGCNPDVVGDCVEIQLENESAVTINPLTGDLIAVPADAQACMGGAPCDAEVVLSPLVLSPNPVDEGANIAVSFTQRGAFECRRSGLPGTSWNTSTFVNPNDQSVSFNVFIPSGLAAGSPYTLLLECRNGVAGEDAQQEVQAQLQVTESGTTPEGCENINGRLRPTTWAKETRASIASPTLETETWRDLFQNDFPLGSTIDVRVRSNRYLALSFNPGTAGTKGGITFTDLSGNITDVEEAPALVSMAACPGDFRPQSGAAVNCRRPEVGAGNAFRWSRLASDQINRCVIDSDADVLYFNVTYVSNATDSGPTPDQLEWACRPDNPTGTCGNRMQPTAQ